MQSNSNSNSFLFLFFAFILFTVTVNGLPLNKQETQKFVVPPSTLEEAPYADWAHVHMVWWHNSLHNQTNNPQLVRDYQTRGVRVGWFNIDSTWDAADPGRLGVGSFTFDPARYPDPEAMLDEIRLELGARVSCWTTSTINLEATTYDYACEQGYFLNDCATFDWWRGTGSYVDYTNPEGVEWYHGLLRNVLEMGVDGWKVDGAEPYMVVLRPKPVTGYQGGIVTLPAYSEALYGDYYNYSNIVNGDKTSLIMARPVDYMASSPLMFAPHYVMFSGWVGDQSGDFAGMREAMTFMLHSGWRNFTNFGSDIAGYGGGQFKESLIRWTQLATFCPFMENGGGGEHRPWMYDEETLVIYRTFVDIHYSIFSYLLTTGTESYEAEISSMRPTSEEPIILPTSWNYKLGNDVFVAPMVNESNIRLVDFPAGDDWVYWMNSSLVYNGGTMLERVFPLNEFPAYRRAGAVIPMDYLYGDEFINSPSITHPITEVPLTFAIYEPRSSVGGNHIVSGRSRPTFGTSVELTYELFELEKKMVMKVSAYEDRDVIIRISSRDSFITPRSVKVNGAVVEKFLDASAENEYGLTRLTNELMSMAPIVVENGMNAWGEGGFNTVTETFVRDPNVFSILLGKIAIGAIVEINY